MAPKKVALRPVPGLPSTSTRLRSESFRLASANPNPNGKSSRLADAPYTLACNTNRPWPQESRLSPTISPPAKSCMPRSGWPESPSDVPVSFREAADANFWLASPLSDYVTGQVITVSGGSRGGMS